MIYLHYSLLITPECHDEQFILEERGTIKAKGLKAPMQCYLLSRNTRQRRRSRLQQWLESGLDLPPSPDLRSSVAKESPACSTVNAMPKGCIKS